ncbi:hypothetical protein SKAU_G00009930 [Synaphobranchus kaupii]|uniref:Guanine nucleotide-binding protein subunit beta-like protein 1 n=1 Tax=Synaphobranchus kaupii TaxID=118154 RepID=A0A9Q1GAV2_SYNKA|nr:hypothetical protein SKAU_G00009930 [Synaphobranchus kaupii]
MSCRGCDGGTTRQPPQTARHWGARGARLTDGRHPQTALGCLLVDSECDLRSISCLAGSRAAAFGLASRATLQTARSNGARVWVRRPESAVRSHSSFSWWDFRDFLTSPPSTLGRLDTSTRAPQGDRTAIHPLEWVLQVHRRMFSSPRVFHCSFLQNDQERVAGLHNTSEGLADVADVMALPPPAPKFILRGSEAPVNTLHFRCQDPGPPLLFSGSGKGAVHVWNLTTRRAENVLEGHGGASVIWLDTLRSSGALISQGRDMRVCTWDQSEGRSSVTDSFSTGSVGFCQCSLLDGPGRCLLAHPGPHMEEVKIMDISSKTPVCSLVPDVKHGMLMCIKLWQPDSGVGPVLLAGYEDGWLSLWDVSQRTPLSGLAAHPQPLMCLDFDPAGQRGVSGSSERAVTSWTLDGQQSLQLQDSVQVVNPGFSQLRIRQDRKILVSAGWDHRVRLFSWKRLKPLAVLQHHADVALSVAFSDHQDTRHRVLAAGSKDQRISVWSVYNDA